jgi:hypothetical protein
VSDENDGTLILLVSIQSRTIIVASKPTDSRTGSIISMLLSLYSILTKKHSLINAGTASVGKDHSDKFLESS